MIIVRIWGGIGNQLFQYVFGEYLRYAYHQDVYYDNNSFGKVDKQRKPELEILNSSLSYNNSFSFSRYRGLKNRVLRFIFQLNPRQHYIEEGNSIPREYHPNHIYYFQGYWQDIKYYRTLCDVNKDFKIESVFFPKELDPYRRAILESEDSISIHIRRGDYFTPKNVNIYGVCTEDYYVKALQSIRSKHPNAKTFFFSDDIDWVKQHLTLDLNSIVIPNHNVPQFSYIELMSLCKHHIISNSSFSWWGAVINAREEAIVIAPNRWKRTSDSTIALKEWIKIDVK